MFRQHQWDGEKIPTVQLNLLARFVHDYLANPVQSNALPSKDILLQKIAQSQRERTAPSKASTTTATVASGTSTTAKTATEASDESKKKKGRKRGNDEMQETTTTGNTASGASSKSTTASGEKDKKGGNEGKNKRSSTSSNANIVIAASTNHALQHFTEVFLHTANSVSSSSTSTNNNSNTAIAMLNEADKRLYSTTCFDSSVHFKYGHKVKQIFDTFKTILPALFLVYNFGLYYAFAHFRSVLFTYITKRETLTSPIVLFIRAIFCIEFPQKKKFLTFIEDLIQGQYHFELYYITWMITTLLPPITSPRERLISAQKQFLDYATQFCQSTTEIQYFTEGLKQFIKKVKDEEADRYIMILSDFCLKLLPQLQGDFYALYSYFQMNNVTTILKRLADDSDLITRGMTLLICAPMENKVESETLLRDLYGAVVKCCVDVEMKNAILTKVLGGQPLPVPVKPIVATTASSATKTRFSSLPLPPDFDERLKTTLEKAEGLFLNDMTLHDTFIVACKAIIGSVQRKHNEDFADSLDSLKNLCDSFSYMDIVKEIEQLLPVLLGQKSTSSSDVAQQNVPLPPLPLPLPTVQSGTVEKVTPLPIPLPAPTSSTATGSSSAMASTMAAIQQLHAPKLEAPMDNKDTVSVKPEQFTEAISAPASTTLARPVPVVVESHPKPNPTIPCTPEKDLQKDAVDLTRITPPLPLESKSQFTSIATNNAPPSSSSQGVVPLTSTEPNDEDNKGEDATSNTQDENMYIIIVKDNDTQFKFRISREKSVMKLFKKYAECKNIPIQQCVFSLENQIIYPGIQKSVKIMDSKIRNLDVITVRSQQS